MFGHTGNSQLLGDNNHDMSSSVDAAAQSLDDNHGTAQGNSHLDLGSMVVPPSGNGGSSPIGGLTSHDLASHPSSQGSASSAPPLFLTQPSNNSAPTTDSTPPPPKPAIVPQQHNEPAPHPANDDLMMIKQDALQHLQPLVGQLDQPPEEQFRTIMMMIQASDDQSLIKPAYASAQQIPDDKQRAQALLDIVNEINYFTRKQD